MAPLKWLEVGDRVPAVRPQTDATYEELGLTALSTPEDIKAAIKQRLSALPEEVFEGDALKSRIEELVRSDPSEAAAESVRGFWDVYYCLERQIGFWGLITIVGIIIVAISCVAATLLAWWACFWLPALIWIGITTFITLVACILGWG